jgi:probable addiction module antidote protein
MTIDYSTFEASDYLDNEEVVAEYLTAAAEDENPDMLLRALSEVAKARGMSQVAAAAGLGRESLYKALAPGSHPRFETISAVLRALNVRLAVVPAGAAGVKS